MHRRLALAASISLLVVSAASSTLAAPMPPTRGSGRGLYCDMLNAMDTPRHPDCHPPGCQHCDGAWWGVCNFLTQAAQQTAAWKLEHMGRRLAAASLEMATIMIHVLEVFSDYASATVCNTGSGLIGAPAQREYACTTYGENSVECRTWSLLLTCACMGKVETRQSYMSLMSQYCDLCSCYHNSTHTSGDTWGYDIARRCLNQARPRPGQGRTFGDPNLTTLDGGFLADQRAGEFVAVKQLATVSGNYLQVQLRYQPMGPMSSVSMTTAVAIGYNGSRVAFYAGAPVEVRVNGTVTSVPGQGLEISSGLWIEPSWMGTGTFNVTAPNGDRVVVSSNGSFLNATVELTSDLSSQTLGVLGNFNGDPTDEPSAWGVNDYRITTLADSLFDYRGGETLATFNDPTFPAQPFDPSSFSPGAQQTAQQACQSAGVTDPVTMTGCVRDHLATSGSTDFLSAATWTDFRSHCGDGVCDGTTGENCNTCPVDCGRCLAPEPPVDVTAPPVQ